jgi:hypothetical protein
MNFPAKQRYTTLTGDLYTHTHTLPSQLIEARMFADYKFPKGERVFTDGSLNASGGIGAVYNEETTDTTTRIRA